MEESKFPIVTNQAFLETYKLKKIGLVSSRNLKLPLYGNVNLAKIAAYITFDGHLSLEKNMFYFSAGKRSELKEFKSFIKDELDVEGRIQRVQTSLGKTYKCIAFNKPICRVLYLMGVSPGAKVNTSFDVPKWIFNNREFSRSYLQVAFDCEGSIWREGSNRRKIRFRINKSTDLIENGIKFLNTLKTMLMEFDIHTTKIWTCKSNIRKDGKITRVLAFNILARDIPIFKKEIGFKINHKKNLLNGAIGMGQARETRMHEAMV